MDPKEAFLDLIADSQFYVEPDADIDSNGSTIDYTTFSIRGPIQVLEDFVKALGIPRRFDESVEDAIYRAIAVVTKELKP